jgi:RHS repeat-associated protein
MLQKPRLQTDTLRFFYITLLILTIVSLIQAPTPIQAEENSGAIGAQLIGEPSCFVNRSVNIITGDYQENVIDFEVAGPHPLTCQRSYVSSQTTDEKDQGICYQWNRNHVGELTFSTRNGGKSKKHLFAKVKGDCGSVIRYHLKGAKKKKENILSVHPQMLQKYTTNSPNQDAHAGSHIKTNRVIAGKKDKDGVSLTTGDGYHRFYVEKSAYEYPYILKHERLPNGCLIQHEPEREDKGISLRNGSNKELSFLFSPATGVPYVRMMQGSDGRWVKYYCQRADGRSFLRHVEGSDIPHHEYDYTDYGRGSEPKISAKKLPEGRFLQTEYYREGMNQNADISIYIPSSDPRKNRVMLQKAPVGSDNTPIVTHHFFYNLRTQNGEALGGTTTVLDAHGHKTEYVFNDDYRLTEIRKLVGAHDAHSVERLFWGNNDTPDSTNLLSRTLSNGNNEVKICRTYSYDQFGNAISKSIWGNLTGKCPGNIAIGSNGIPQGGSECCSKHFVYDTANNPNVLGREEDGKKTIFFCYDPGTNLNTARLTHAEGRFQKREYLGYDENGCLQGTIVDDADAYDGSIYPSATERHITHIKNRTEMPIGLPQVIEKYYLDLSTGKEILQGRVVNVHSGQGRLLSQEHYDSDNILRYTLEWEYDSRGNLTMEKDAIGRVVRRRYDANNNLVYEEGPHPGVYKEFRYDFVNRLIGKTEGHPDGVTLSLSYQYDYLGNKVGSIDTYGNETRYSYANVNQLTKTTFPTILNENMAVVKSTTHFEYDLFDNPCKLTDASGGVTTISYTAYNKPYHKSYPDGTTERFEYDLWGNLVMSEAKNGTKTYYQYDAFDRVTKKEVISATGELLQQEINTYNAFHLLSMTDITGLTTQNHYNQAGHLIATTKGDMRIEYEYDTLGREVKAHTFHGTGPNDYTTKVKEYDLLNRVIEERVEDSLGNIQIKEAYEYDIFDNRQTIYKYNQAGESVTRIEYNTRGQPISITNAAGNQTHIHYRYDYYDEELHQFLPYSESTDPHGITTVLIQDALGRKKVEYKKDSFGKILQKRRSYHTQNNLLSRTVEEVFVDGVCKREVTNVFNYNIADQLLEVCESAGTPDQKITRFTYNAYGQKQAEIKPDGTTISYEYDALGRLQEYQASDTSFHYAFDYDHHSNPIKVRDLIHQTETTRCYDIYNRLIKETLGNGLSVEYTYDLSGRPTKLTYPDGSGMGISYENFFLKDLSRLNQQGDVLYTHSYDQYDLSGNVTKNTLIGQAGDVNYTLDAIGRTIDMKTDLWSSSVVFDALGNIVQKESRDPSGQESSAFKYDELRQLTEEQGGFAEKYAYDSLYNRIRKGASDYTLSLLNQVTDDGHNHYTYDLNGNLICIQSGDNTQSETYLRYDALNRLIQVEKGTQQISYVYDEKNRRLSKTIIDTSLDVSPKSYQYFYQDLNEIGCCENGEITELRLLGIGKGAEIGAAIAMEFNGHVYAPIHDLHGSVVCLVEAETGQIHEFYRYSAFGEEKLYDANGESLETAINPWRFSSKRTDNETGFVYFGRRYYDSNLGRWITQDPIGFDGGPNLYAYVLNNPLTNFDLYGLQTQDSARTENCFTAVRDTVCSVFEGIRDCVSSFCESVSDGLSRCSESLSSCFSFERDGPIASFFPKVLSSFASCRPSYTYSVGEGEPANVGFGNGIATTKEGNKSHAKILSDAADGRKIASTVNPTHGIIRDLFRAFCSLVFGYDSNVVDVLEAKFRDFFATSSPDAIWLESCHSEEAINLKHALKRLEPELRARIDVLAIAPATYIERYLCRSVTHYVSERDFIPWLDFIGRFKNSDTIQVLEPHKDANLLDHNFDSPTYRNVIEKHIREHLEKNGY